MIGAMTSKEGGRKEGRRGLVKIQGDSVMRHGEKLSDIISVFSKE